MSETVTFFCSEVSHPVTYLIVAGPNGFWKI